MTEQAYQIGGIGITMVCPDFHESEALSHFRTPAPHGRILRFEVTVKSILSLPEGFPSLPQGCHELCAEDGGGTVRVIFHDGTKQAILIERREKGLHRVELLDTALPI